jgi:hypothetical protein
MSYPLDDMGGSGVLKIAINMTLISQVENTNKLNAYAKSTGLDGTKFKTF